jgi:hypothetical protein
MGDVAASIHDFGKRNSAISAAVTIRSSFVTYFERRSKIEVSLDLAPISYP